MKVLKNIKVPTGNIVIMQGEMGKKLELLSLGDYGQQKNVKADFLGLSNEVNGVNHGELLPLEEKWVITISSQYGCSMGCTFCDVPKVGSGVNATYNDLLYQFATGISIHPEVKKTKRLNLHFARMGEPTWNLNVLTATESIYHSLKSKNWGFHPVLSTMMPKSNRLLQDFLFNWMELKNDTLNGEAGLQLSINTTDDRLRSKSMRDNTLSLKEISRMVNSLPEPLGRKIALNFALTEAPIDEIILADLFDPRYFMCKITPMHMTNACNENNISTVDGYEKYYPYKSAEERLKSVGFDVLVFVPSYEEDLSRITCGNAILSGSNAEYSVEV